MNANVSQSLPRVLLLAFLGCGVLGSTALAGPMAGRQPSDFAGAWEVLRDQAPRRCRIMLNAEQSDKGDFFVGVPVACRHMMPILSKVGRWTLADPTHLNLNDPSGTSIMALVADGDAFTGRGADGVTYRLASVGKIGRSATAPEDPLTSRAEASPPTLIKLGATTTNQAASVAKIADAEKPAKRNRGIVERPIDMAGRYAIFRDKTHDTGCMLTLDDKTRVKGGERAALAPACRDQGIVVFDPSAWQVIDGRLILTAKAGHTTHLDKQDDGTWLKDPSEGKSLSLKKL